MNISPKVLHESPPERRSCWHTLAAITVAVHVSILLSPIRIVDLRSGLLPIEQCWVLLVPAVWSIFIFFRYRHPSERFVAYCSLAASVLWFLAVGFIRS